MVMMNGNYSEMIFPAYLGEILGLYWPGLGLEQKIDHNEPVWEMRWSFREPGGGDDGGGNEGWSCQIYV